MSAAILGLGHHLPPVVERVGVRRPIAVEAIGPSTLAARAAETALSRAGLSADAIDFIVFATMTPDVVFPGSGCYFQHATGCRTVGALDVRAQCAGFVFALGIADQFIRAGIYERVLVAGAEVHSSGLDYSDRGVGVARLYGDGAGVAVVGRRDGASAIRGIAMHSDGRRYKEFWCEYPASRQHPVRFTLENFRQGKHFITLDVDAVSQFGRESLPAVIREALLAADLPAHRIDRFIIGHILPEVAEAVGKQLEIPTAALNIPAARHGHLTAAALPVALSEEIESGTLGPGATVCLAASGAGFAWGAAVVTL